MAYGLRNRGMPKPEIDRAVREAAKILEISDFLDRKPRALSGGQRQRVAMGRAIVRQPKAFLFDEPLSNLDAKLRVSMRVEIKKLQRTLRDHVDLRHPRPAGGDDARRHAGGDECRPGRADRRAARRLRAAGDDLRRRLHRRAADEPVAHAAGGVQRGRRRIVRAAGRGRDRGRAPGGSRSRRRGRADQMAGSRCRSRSRRSSRSDPRASSTAASSAAATSSCAWRARRRSRPARRSSRWPTRSKLHVFAADGRRRLDA